MFDVGAKERISFQYMLYLYGACNYLDWKNKLAILSPQDFFEVFKSMFFFKSEMLQQRVWHVRLEQSQILCLTLVMWLVLTKQNCVSSSTRWHVSLAIFNPSPRVNDSPLLSVCIGVCGGICLWYCSRHLDTTTNWLEHWQGDAWGKLFTQKVR